MKTIKFLLLMCAMITAGLTGSSAAADANSTSNTASSPSANPTLPAADVPPRCASGTSKSASRTFNGRKIQYRVSTGQIGVKNSDASACVFYTSYVVQPADETRPLLFAFSNEPGAGSLRMHLGLLGPGRVDLGKDGLTPGKSGSPPALVKNANFPLDIADIVIFDPPGTGFSSIVSGTLANWNSLAERDYALGIFVENYLDSADRWASPKFILAEGESAIDLGRLARSLQSKQDIALSGLIFLSPVFSKLLNEESSLDSTEAFVGRFPSYVVTAWYHRRLPTKLQAMKVEALFEAARTFATGALRSALVQGNGLDPASFDSIVSVYSEMTSLPRDLVARKRLKITAFDFNENLFKKERRVISSMDGRISGAFKTVDPSNFIGFAFKAGINRYLRKNLGVRLERQNYLLAPQPEPLDGAPQVLTDLSEALATNPDLQILSLSGYFDMMAPLATAEFALSQLPDGLRFRQRVVSKRYAAGHLLYLAPAQAAKLKSDLADFMMIRGTPSLPQDRLFQAMQ